MGYVALTVARNEEDLIEHTIQSVLSQTVPPKTYIVVDDGSTDKTPNIIKAYEDQGVIYYRLEGIRTGVKSYDICRAVNMGQRLALKHVPDWDFLLKLDADSRIPMSYAETMMRYMENDGALGIVSGSIHNRNSLEGRPSDGAKLFRRRCWDAIGGMDYVLGWDTHAIIKCNMAGYKALNTGDPYTEMRSSRRQTPQKWYQSGVTRFILGFPIWHTMVAGAASLNDKPCVLGACIMVFTHLILRFTKGGGRYSKYYQRHMRRFAVNETIQRVQKVLHRNSFMAR